MLPVNVLIIFWKPISSFVRATNHTKPCHIRGVLKAIQVLLESGRAVESLRKLRYKQTLNQLSDSYAGSTGLGRSGLMQSASTKIIWKKRTTRCRKWRQSITMLNECAFGLAKEERAQRKHSVSLVVSWILTASTVLLQIKTASRIGMLS